MTRTVLDKVGDALLRFQGGTTRPVEEQEKLSDLRDLMRNIAPDQLEYVSASALPADFSEAHVPGACHIVNHGDFINPLESPVKGRPGAVRLTEGDAVYTFFETTHTNEYGSSVNHFVIESRVGREDEALVVYADEYADGWVQTVNKGVASILDQYQRSVEKGAQQLCMNLDERLSEVKFVSEGNPESSFDATVDGYLITFTRESVSEAVPEVKRTSVSVSKRDPLVGEVLETVPGRSAEALFDRAAKLYQAA